MISPKQIGDAYERATLEFSNSKPFEKLISGKLNRDELQSFISNVFQTHYLSSHIIAFLFATLPSKASELLKENLLEEMGLSQEGKAHSVLLLDLAGGAGFNDKDIERLIYESQQQLRMFCAKNNPFPTLRDLVLSILLETMSFEFLLSRCSGKIANALQQHYSYPKQSVHWFELHSEVDIRHAEEGIEVIQDYLTFHRIDDADFTRILQVTFGENVFLKRYFPSV